MSGSTTIIGLGEALFDVFDGHARLGGAPLNMVVHARRLIEPFGGRAMLVSRVGCDALGEQLRRELRGHGVDDQAIQTDPALPTGRVTVRFDQGGQPCYQIESPAAWEALEYTAALSRLAPQADAVCFGTLAQRAARSREAIHAFIEDSRAALRICDVNLRSPHFDHATVHRSFTAADVVKLNRQELHEVCELLEISSSRRTTGMADLNAHALLQRYRLQVVAVTRGPRGMVIYTPDGKHEGDSASRQNGENGDPVGAGDAALAALTVGLLKRWPWRRIASWANRIGAFVASHPGATPTLTPDLLSPVDTPAGEQVDSMRGWTTSSP